MEQLDRTDGNARLTATTAVVLLVLLAGEGVTILSIRPLLSAHIVIGLLLIPPVALKLASVGYRFVRYYTGDAAYVDRGPPHIAMRLLAPFLVIATVAVLATGVGLLVFGPKHHRDLLLGLHKASFAVWFGLMSIHVLVYAPRLPRLVSARGALAQRATIVATSVVAGALLAGAAYSLAGPWVHGSREHDRERGAQPRVLRLEVPGRRGGHIGENAVNGRDRRPTRPRRYAGEMIARYESDRATSTGASILPGNVAVGRTKVTA